MVDVLVRRWRRCLVAVAVVGGSILVAGPASAESPEAVDFTVSETKAGGPGTLIESDIEGCSTLATVETLDPSVTTTGAVITFAGTKIVDCGEGNTFTLTFRARVTGCSSTDFGTWRLVDGTGSFAGAKGQGQLLGTYTYEDGPGTQCENDGIDDRYTGKIKLAS